MKKPISLMVDFDAEAGTLGYLRFRALEAGKHVARTHRVSDDVFVDFNDTSEILGIELLGFDDEVIGAARHFAEQHGLAFPELLRAPGPGMICTSDRIS
jgi:uncharacterized protein YuzE